MADTLTIEEWRPDFANPSSIDADVEMLADVLRAVVYGGAGVSFFVPFSIDDARAFWRDKVLPGVRAGTRRVVVARAAGLVTPEPHDGEGARIVGTVQLEMSVPPNQRHRADVLKLLVHPSARRRGIARALMVALEAIAREEGRTLLTLDTVTGSAAEPLYVSLGYTIVGVVPRYARKALSEELEAATFMYKELRASR